MATDPLGPLPESWDAAELGGLQSRPYRSDHLTIVVHPSHPLADRRSV